VKRITIAGNTLVPTILALERAGFVVTSDDDGETVSAVRGDETYTADSPEALLGLVRLVELNGWNWHASDEEIDEVSARHPWLG
jgi:hypothetical protein